MTIANERLAGPSMTAESGEEKFRNPFSCCVNEGRLIRPLPIDRHVSWDQVDPRVASVVVRAVDEERWPLTLCGHVGSGKTSVAALIYASWPFKYPKFFRMTELMSFIRSARREGCVRLPGSEQVVSESNIWNVRIDRPSLLVLDDLGVRNPSPEQFEMTFQAIDMRDGRPLVLSTNHSPEMIYRVFDQRIGSRITGGTVIEFPDVDRRMNCGRIVSFKESS